MNDQKKQQVYDDFNEATNMAPAELERWLQTDESKSVGQDSGDGESTGHQSGRRIIEIKRKPKAELTEADYQHMQKVVGYIHRHDAQRPSGDISDTPWRYSLKNWGHDPAKD